MPVTLTHYIQNYVHIGLMIFWIISVAYFAKKIITIAVFPYSTSLITRGHHQDINR
jgi:hypothetical protein